MQCDCNNPVYTRLDEITCGVIDESNSVLRKYADACPNVGKLLDVTRIECRFGHQFVLAEILPAGGNGTDAIVCTAPPFEYGVRVPLALTLNRVDYTPIEPLKNCLQGTDPCTYFQYLAPKPQVVPAFQAPLTSGASAVATLSPNFDKIVIQFNKPTDMGGQPQRMADLFGANSEYSGCVRYLKTETVLLLGSSTMPKCEWSIQKDKLIIEVGESPAFDLQTILYLAEDADMQVHKIHTSRLPMVLVPTTPAGPAGSDYYDGALEAHVESRLRERDGIITNEELEARGVEPIATDGTVTSLDPVLGLELLPQLSYLFEPMTTCLDVGEDAVETEAPCPVRFRLELGATGGEAKPLVKIDGPGVVDACTEVIALDARRSTGRLGRDFSQAKWFLLETPSGVKLSTRKRLEMQLRDSLPSDMLQTRIVCNPSEVFTTDEELIGASDVLCKSLGYGAFKIGLNITSWVGLTGSGSFSFQRARQAAGKVSIAGDAHKLLTVGDKLSLYGYGEKSACVQEGEPVKLSYTWTIHDRDDSSAEQLLQDAMHTSAITRTKMDLTVPAFALPLKSMHRYIFVLHLNHTYLGESFISTAQTVVEVVPARPVARIAGGSRTVAATQDLTLDGSSSYDPGVQRAQRSAAGLVMCWSCVLGPCIGKLCSGGPCPWNATNASRWHVPHHQLALDSQYAVTLTAVGRTQFLQWIGKSPAPPIACMPGTFRRPRF